MGAGAHSISIQYTPNNGSWAVSLSNTIYFHVGLEVSPETPNEYYFGFVGSSSKTFADVRILKWSAYISSAWTPVATPREDSPQDFPPSHKPEISPQSIESTDRTLLVVGLVIVTVAIIIVGLLLWRRKFQRQNGEDMPLLQLDEQPRTEELHKLPGHDSRQEINSKEPMLNKELLQHEETQPKPSNIPFEDIVLRGQLGEGTFGQVFKADLHGETVVVKMLRLPEVVPQEAFRKEAETLMSLRHTNIVLSRGMAENKDGDLLLVMEYMDNGSLADLLFRDKIKLKRSQILTLALDVSRGLNYLHSLTPKIIHRDLKSGNVLLFNDKKNAKISDFGAARFLEAKKEASTVIGSLGFIAPEIIDESNYNEKADIYSFGALLFEMITNEPPPTTNNEEQRLAKIRTKVVDPDLQNLVVLCCKTDPLSRPTIRQCIEILMQLKAMENVV